jgi:hypothetical protein
VTKKEKAGATVAPHDKPTDKFEVLSNNFNTLAQGLVNQYYELTRIQILLDAIMLRNKVSLTMPSDDELKKIEDQAAADTRKTYAVFFNTDPNIGVDK